MIKIITDKTDFEAYKSDWDSLYEKTTKVTSFQKFGYVLATLDFVASEGYSLCFILLRDAQRKETVAIFPFVKSQSCELEFFNQRHADFCMPLINPEVDHFNIYKELAEQILNDKSVKGLNLNNLPISSSLVSSLKFHFKLSIVYDINYYPLVPIISSNQNKIFIDGLTSVPSKRRGNLKKSYTQIADKCTLKVMRKSDGYDYPKEIVHYLTNQMVSKGIRKSKYFSQDMLSWWRRLYDVNVLSLAILFEEQKPVACTLVFIDDVKNEFITWIMLYVDSVWNMRTNLFISKYIYDQGSGTLNLARGIYDYKVTNFHPDIKPLFGVKVAKTKWWHFKNIISTVFHYSKPIIKSWLGR